MQTFDKTMAAPDEQFRRGYRQTLLTGRHDFAPAPGAGFPRVKG